MEHSPLFTARMRGIGLVRSGARAFGIEGHHRVDGTIARLHPLEMSFEGIATGELAGRDGGTDFARRLVGRVRLGHGGPRFLLWVERA